MSGVVTAPTPKNLIPFAWGKLSISAGVVTLDGGHNVLSVADMGVGMYVVALKKILPSTLCSIVATADHNWNTTVCAGLAGDDSIGFQCGWEDGENTRTDPFYVHFVVYVQG